MIAIFLDLPMHDLLFGYKHKFLKPLKLTGFVKEPALPSHFQRNRDPSGHPPQSPWPTYYRQSVGEMEGFAGFFCARKHTCKTVLAHKNPAVAHYCSSRYTMYLGSCK
jgi:hypothetical protein